jgi:hypothetical protein
MHSKCKDKQMLIYGWGRNAHGLVLPDGVGYRVGGASGFSHAVLEVHYLKAQGAINGGDSSGVVMHLTYDEQPFEAGILMFATVRQKTAGSGGDWAEMRRREATLLMHDRSW